MTLTAVIPALREPGVRHVVPAVARHVDRVVVVVEDFDTFTRRCALEAGADQVVTSTARCLRGAVEAGWAETDLADDVLTLDGDGAQVADQIPSLLDRPTDVVIGSRFLPGSHYSGPWWRHAGSRAFGLACARCANLAVRDWGGGFRLYRAGAVHELVGSRARGHAWQAEALGRAHRAGMTITETPVTYFAGRTTLSHGAALEALGVLARLATGA